MAPVKNKVSPWFYHPAGFGWKCRECARCNSLKVKQCSKCGAGRVKDLKEK